MANHDEWNPRTSVHARVRRLDPRRNETTPCLTLSCMRLSRFTSGDRFALRYSDSFCSLTRPKVYLWNTKSNLYNNYIVLRNNKFLLFPSLKRSIFSLFFWSIELTVEKRGLSWPWFQALLTKPLPYTCMASLGGSRAKKIKKSFFRSTYKGSCYAVEGSASYSFIHRFSENH